MKIDSIVWGKDMRQVILLLACFLCQPVWAESPATENTVQHTPNDGIDDMKFDSIDRAATLFGIASGLEGAEKKEGCAKALALLEGAGMKLDLGKVIAYKGSPVCYQNFKQQGMPWPEAAKRLGVGPLHVAVKYNNREMITWLIQQAPDLLDSQDKEGRRPLLYSQDDAMVKFLLDHGATPPEEWVK